MWRVAYVTDNNNDDEDNDDDDENEHYLSLLFLKHSLNII